MNGQVSVEFMIIATLLLAMVAAITTVSVITLRDIQFSAIQQETENILGVVGGALNTVYLEGDGFATNVSLPQHIRGLNYTVNLSRNFLTITVRNISFTRPLLTNASGILTIGKNAVGNVNGEVRIS